MFWKSKADPRLLGVPLADLITMLQPTSVRASLKGNTLTARHERYRIRVEVVPPEAQASRGGAVRAVLRLTTELPKSVLALFHGDVAAPAARGNAFAALGALYADHDGVCIGSRLSIGAADDAWRSLHLPLLTFTTICGSEAILGALRGVSAGDDRPGGSSKWSERDLMQVAATLPPSCLCNTGASSLRAEVDLGQRPLRRTAVFQLSTGQPHPVLGGGLSCVLQMPHRVRDEHRLNQVCLQLNKMEMAARDLPPHFGAWSSAPSGSHPSYVSFLPNPLHASTGIAVHAARWALRRARWADEALASLGAGGA